MPVSIKQFLIRPQRFGLLVLSLLDRPTPQLWEGLPILSTFPRSSSPAEQPSEVPTGDAKTLPTTRTVIFTPSPVEASLNHVAGWYKGCFL